MPDLFLKKVLLLWLIFPAVSIPISFLARRIGYHDFFPRLLVWFAIIPIFLLASYMGGYYFAGLITGCCLIACFELTSLENSIITHINTLILALSLCIPWIIWILTAADLPLLILTIVILIALMSIFLRLFQSHPWFRIFSLFILLGACMGFWVGLQNILGFRGVTFAFSVVVLNDILAFLFGKMLSGPRLFPRLSPNKTLAGFIGGGSSAVLVGYIFWFTLPEFSFLQITTAGSLLALSGSTGDLFASSVKRYHGVKDFSRIFGPMGGMLDRLDSLLFSGWLFYLYIQIFVLV